MSNTLKNKNVFAAYHFIRYQANRNAGEFLNSIVAKTQVNHSYGTRLLPTCKCPE